MELNVAQEIIELAAQLKDFREISFDGTLEVSEGLENELRRKTNETVGKFKKIFSQYGLITFSEFGEQASIAAWDIVHHADETEIDLKSKYVELMEGNIEEIDKQAYAYLRDRVEIFKGNKQIYGTQFQVEDKCIKFDSILDPANLDLRRSYVGLEPIDEYIDALKKHFKESIERIAIDL